MNTPIKTRKSMTHAVESATLADVLERILDKGLVIAGDIKIKIVDIELLTIQIRLLVCSVDKAREIGIDWWSSSPYLNGKLAGADPQTEALSARIARLEAGLPPAVPLSVPVAAAAVDSAAQAPLPAAPMWPGLWPGGFHRRGVVLSTQAPAAALRPRRRRRSPSGPIRRASTRPGPR